MNIKLFTAALAVSLSSACALAMAQGTTTSTPTTSTATTATPATGSTTTKPATSTATTAAPATGSAGTTTSSATTAKTTTTTTTPTTKAAATGTTTTTSTLPSVENALKIERAKAGQSRSGTQPFAATIPPGTPITDAKSIGKDTISSMVSSATSQESAIVISANSTVAAALSAARSNIDAIPSTDTDLIAQTSALISTLESQETALTSTITESTSTSAVAFEAASSTAVEAIDSSTDVSGVNGAIEVAENGVNTASEASIQAIEAVAVVPTGDGGGVGGDKEGVAVTKLDSVLSGMNFGAEIKLASKDYDTSLVLSPRFNKGSQLYGIGAEYDLKNGIRLGLGYTYGQGSKKFGTQKWSIDAETNQASIDDLKLEQKAHLFMLNGYYDIGLPGLDSFTPYIGAGLGYANHAYTLTVPDSAPAGGKYAKGRHKKDKSGIAYAIYTGLNYNISELTAVGLGYQFSSLGQGAMKGKNAFNIKDGTDNTAKDKLVELKGKSSHGILANISTKF